MIDTPKYSKAIMVVMVVDDAFCFSSSWRLRLRLRLRLRRFSSKNAFF
jgi:hypothetical protein